MVFTVKGSRQDDVRAGALCGLSVQVGGTGRGGCRVRTRPRTRTASRRGSIKPGVREPPATHIIERPQALPNTRETPSQDCAPQRCWAAWRVMPSRAPISAQE